MNKTRSYEHTRLSIQLSLNGLSFCITDLISNQLIEAKRLRFSTSLNESELKVAVEDFLKSENLLGKPYESVVAIHNNPLFNIVPLSLLNKNKLIDYIKYNSQVLPTDQTAVDQIEQHEIAVVYIPFTAANNVIFDAFGTFDFKHHCSVHLDELLSIQHGAQEVACYIHHDQGILSMTLIKNKKLIFFNHFKVQGTEDSLYYILFTLSQLEIDLSLVHAHFYGETTSADSFFNKAKQYISHCSIFRPNHSQKVSQHISEHHFDRITLNA